MSSYALGSGPITCKGCTQPLRHIARQCPSCEKTVDIATLLMVVTEKVELGEERQTILAQLRNVFAGGPSVTPGARAHFGKSGPSGKVAALLAVQASGDSSEFPATIMEMSYERADRQLKIEIIRTLGMAGSEESVRVLQRIIEEEQDEEVLVSFGEKLDDSVVGEITFPSLEVMEGVKGSGPAKDQVAGRIDARLPLGPVQEKDAREGEALIDKRVPSQNPAGPERPVSLPPASLLGSFPPPHARSPAEPLEDIFGVDGDNAILSPPKPEHRPPVAKPVAIAPPPVVGFPPEKAPPPDAMTPRPAVDAPVGRVAQPRPQLPEQPPEPLADVIAPRQPQAPAHAGRSVIMLVIGALLGGLLGAASTVGVLYALGALGNRGDVAATRSAHPPALDPPPSEGEPMSAQQVVPSLERADEDAAEPASTPAEEPGTGEVVSHATPVAAKLAYTVEASSSHKKYPPSNLADGDPATVWQESKSEWAIGQKLTFKFDGPVTVVKIGVVVGYDLDHPTKGDFFAQNNRLKSASLIFGDESSQPIELEDQRGMQWLQVQPPGPVEELTLKVKDVYRGGTYNDNAIAEVEIWGY